MARRQLKKHHLRKALFIVCEGKNTEPIYFRGLVEQITQLNTGYAFHVMVHDTPKTNPVGLVEEARKLMLYPEDEAWVVYDKDGYTKHQEAFALAQQEPRVNIAFSSISFEQWVLLHFERSARAYAKSKNIIDHLQNANLMRNYSKKNSFHLYPRIQTRTHIAIENAAWLRHHMHQPLLDAKAQFYHVNPYTTVDKLVLKLLGIHEKVLWATTAEDIYTNNLVLRVQSAVQSAHVLEVELSIQNKKPTAFLLNPNLNQIYIRDKHYNQIMPIAQEKTLVGHNETFWYTYPFELNGQPRKYRFYIEIERTIIIVQL